MVFLASDPAPEVAELAQYVVHDVHNKVSIGCYLNSMYVKKMGVVMVDPHGMCQSGFKFLRHCIVCRILRMCNAISRLRGI